MADMNFAKGLYFNEPHQNAPDFVLGSMSIKPKEFIDWMRENHQAVDENGYLRLAVKRSKGGKAYVALDTWKPEKRPQEASGWLRGRFWDEDVPFAPMSSL